MNKVPDAVEKIYCILVDVFMALFIFYYIVEESSRHSVENMMKVVLLFASIIAIAGVIRAIKDGVDLAEEVAIQRLKTLKLGILPAQVILAVLIPASFFLVFIGGALITFFLGPAAPLLSGAMYLLSVAIIIMMMLLCLLPGAVVGIQLLRQRYKQGKMNKQECIVHGILLFIPFVDAVDAMLLAKWRLR